VDFVILFYKDKKGKRPVEEFIIGLKRKNNPLAEQTIKGLEKLRNRAYHREPLSKYIEAGLWELRIRARTDILRILYTFSKGRIIVLLHGFIKKQQKTPPGELDLARNRLKEIRLKEAN
jgi:phage-related protein